MLSKPSVFTRNDPITRRDVQPVLGNGARLATASAVTNPNGKPASAEAANTSVAQEAPPTLVNTIESPAGDQVMEARLIVGPDVKLKGAEILDCDTLVVEGRVEATMDSRVIRIAEKGYFSGKVSIDIAEIHGTFEGELTARSQLIIHSTGRVNGTIRFGKLVVDEGGELCGDINIISAKTSVKGAPVLEPFVKTSVVGS